MTRINNIIFLSIVILTTLCQGAQKLDHRILPNNKILMIKAGEKHSYLAKYVLIEKNKEKFLECIGSPCRIPLKGNACEFKIILLNSGHIAVYNTQYFAFVLFDANCNLVTNIEDVNKIFNQLNNNSSLVFTHFNHSNLPADIEEDWQPIENI